MFDVLITAPNPGRLTFIKQVGVPLYLRLAKPGTCGRVLLPVTLLDSWLVTSGINLAGALLEIGLSSLDGRPNADH